MGILSEKEMYFKAAERAFYRNPFSDLLIVSFATLNSDDEGWKGLQLPVLLVPTDGTIPGATSREITRRRRVNLYVWGDSNTVPDKTLNELTTLTSGKVYRILGYEKNNGQDAEEFQTAPLESGSATPDTPGPASEDANPDVAAVEPEAGEKTTDDEPEMADAAASPGENASEEEKDRDTWQDEVVAVEEDNNTENVDSLAESSNEEKTELTVDLAGVNTEGDDSEESPEIVDEDAGEKLAGSDLPGDESTTEVVKTSAEDLTEEDTNLTVETGEETPGETAEKNLEESEESSDEIEGNSPESTDAADEPGQETGDTEADRQITEAVISRETGYAKTDMDTVIAETGQEAGEEPVMNFDDAETDENNKTYGKNVIIWRFPS